jgi:hypothetical protein
MPGRIEMATQSPETKRIGYLLIIKYLGNVIGTLPSVDNFYSFQFIG